MEGAAAIAALFLIPSEGARLSFARLALIGFIFLTCIIWIYAGLRLPHVPDNAPSPVYFYTCVLLTVTFGLSLFLLRYLNPERSLSAYARLSPLLWYLLILSIQFFFYILL